MTSNRTMYRIQMGLGLGMALMGIGLLTIGFWWLAVPCSIAAGGMIATA